MTHSTSRNHSLNFIRLRLRLNACILATLAVLLLSPIVSAQSATIVATDSVNIRACPALDCEIISSAPLGDDVLVVGDPVNGFVPVTHGDVRGFALGLFLSSSTGDPWFSHGRAGCMRIALIFNIGIGDTPSQSVLTTLIDRNVPTTMFPMGGWATEHPEYLLQIRDAGFTIGTHGQDEILLTGASDVEIRTDLLASIEAITRITGQPVAPWATPYAADSDARVRRIIAALGYMPVGWNVSASDYNDSATKQSVLDHVLPNVSDGAIVEFHLDGPTTETSTALALPEIVDTLRADGYALVTVPDLSLPCTSLQEQS